MWRNEAELIKVTAARCQLLVAGMARAAGAADEFVNFKPSGKSSTRALSQGILANETVAMRKGVVYYMKSSTPRSSLS